MQIILLIYRNKDFQEVTLEKNGEVLLRFAAAYGFRNIQNMILKLKKGKFPYHFVEVLACPRGKGFRRPLTACTSDHVSPAWQAILMQEAPFLSCSVRSRQLDPWVSLVGALW